MINRNWSRWIKTSIRKYFDDNKGDLPLIFQLQKKLINEYVEIRIGGPTFKTQQGNLYETIVGVNSLITLKLSQTDLSRNEKIIGQVESLFVENIIILNDDSQIVGCLSKDGEVVVTYFGKDHATGVEQAVVESTYKVTLQGE